MYDALSGTLGCPSNTGYPDLAGQAFPQHSCGCLPVPVYLVPLATSQDAQPRTCGGNETVLKQAVKAFPCSHVSLDLNKTVCIALRSYNFRQHG